MILRLTSLSDFRRLVQLSMDDKQRFGLLAGRHVAHQRSVLTSSSQKKKKKRQGLYRKAESRPQTYFTRCKIFKGSSNYFCSRFKITGPQSVVLTIRSPSCSSSIPHPIKSSLTSVAVESHPSRHQVSDWFARFGWEVNLVVLEFYVWNWNFKAFKINW